MGSLDDATESAMFGNNTTNSTDDPDAFVDWSLPEDMVLPVRLCLGLVMAIGILGNGLIIASVSLVTKLRTPFYICLASLAVCDVLSLSFLTVLPIIDTTNTDHSNIGEWFCFILLSAVDRGLPLTSITHTLVVTIERYMAICWPFKHTFLNSRIKIIVFLAFVWLMTLGLGLVIIDMTQYLTDVEGGVSSEWCSITFIRPWHLYYDMAGLSCVYFAILVTVAILSALMVRQIKKMSLGKSMDTVKSAADKNRSQAVAIIVAITIMFTVCILPYRILLICNGFGNGVLLTLSVRQLLVLLWISRICMYINSAGNPIIYSMASAAFRRRLLCCRPKPTPANAMRNYANTRGGLREKNTKVTTDWLCLVSSQRS